MSLDLLRSDSENPEQDSFKQFEEFDKKHSFDISRDPGPMQTLVWCNDSPIGTRGGNFICISGLAKSRKSVVASSMASGMLLNNGQDYLNFRCEIPENENILHLDTEQGYYHYYKTVKRIVQNGGGSVKSNFHSKHTRDASPQFRLKYLDWLMDKLSPTVCMIDGITDLIRNPNDENESSDLISYMMQVSVKYDCLMIFVIHTTKGNNKLRGHLGSELERKCETAIRVEKDETHPQFSHVYCKESRNKWFNDFTIAFNELKQDYEVLGSENDQYKVVDKKKQKDNHDIDPKDYHKEHHRSVINRLFSEEIEGMKILSRETSGLIEDLRNNATGGIKTLSKKSAKMWLDYYDHNTWLYCNQENEGRWEKTQFIDLDDSNTMSLFDNKDDEQTDNDLPF